MFIELKIHGSFHQVPVLEFGNTVTKERVAQFVWDVSALYRESDHGVVLHFPGVLGSMEYARELFEKLERFPQTSRLPLIGVMSGVSHNVIVPMIAGCRIRIADINSGYIRKEHIHDSGQHRDAAEALEDEVVRRVEPVLDLIEAARYA